MIKTWGLAAAFSLMVAAPAWAQSDTCGDEPIPPALPTAAEIGQKTPADAQKAKHGAFEDIRAWQGQLKGYRDCLDAAIAEDKLKKQKAVTATKPDADAIARIQADMDATNKAYDHTTDTEERIVNDFHAVSTAYCARTDVDRATCPKT
jgi:hypothetical protein